MTTLPAACFALFVLGASGVVPVMCVVGVRWQALLLAPLAGAMITALAGTCCLITAGSTIAWFLGLSTVGLGIGIVVLRSQCRNDLPRAKLSWRRGHKTSRVVGLLVLIVTVAWSLQPLRVPSIGFDARAIWLLRAAWFAAGHQVALAAYRNPVLLGMHASYPPLVSTTVAVTWQLTGNHSYRLGVVMCSVLTGCAIAAAASVLLETGDLTTSHLRTQGGRVDAVANGSHRFVMNAPLVVSRVVAGLFVLVVFDVVGPFATNGYADPLWSAAAVGAIGYGLLLPLTSVNIGAAAVLLGVAGLTKDEGTATAIAIVALIVVRSVWERWRGRRGLNDGGRHTTRHRSPTVAIIVGCAGIMALVVWPVLMRLIGAAKDVNTSGPREGTLISRLHLTLNAMSPQLHVLLLAVPISVVGGIFLHAQRRRSEMATDLWAWAGLCSGLLIVAAAYITGPGNAPFWLATSVHRTTMFPAAVAWLIIAEWTVISTSPEPTPTRATVEGEAAGTEPNNPSPVMLI